MKITGIKLHTVKSGDTGVVEGEPLRVKGRISLEPNKQGFAAGLKRDLLVPFK